MKAALVSGAGLAPVYADFRDPVAQPGKSLIRVKAAAISHITRSRATGTHYSSGGEWPFVPGVDGVGLTQAGERVYFMLPQKPFGAMGEWCLVDERRCFPVPAALSDAAAAAMAIPGMSSWAALLERAQLRAGETVLINGGSGASGRLAIQIARHLGARRVIATARQVNSHAQLRALGADATLTLAEDREALARACREEFARGVDIVLDYLWGMSAETLLMAAAQAGAESVPIRYVQIGSMSAADINLPSAVLRSSALTLMGSGVGSIPATRLLQAAQGVLEAAPAAGFSIATESVPLAQIEHAWNAARSDARIVVHP